jgi:hypothetical protein
MATTFAITTAHALILTVSHGLLFRQPRYARRHRCRRFCLLPVVTERHLNPIASAERAENRSCVNVISPQQCSPHRRIHPRCHTPSVMYSVMRASFRIDARRTDETSRLNFHGLNIRALNPAILYAVQSGFRYPAIACQLPLVSGLRCQPFGANSWSSAPGLSGQRGTLISGRFRGRKLVGSGRYSKCFFAGVQCSPFMPGYLQLPATRARGTSLRSGRGAAGARPAAANRPATGADWPAPSSTTSTPPGASNAGAAAAMAR